MSVSTPHTSKTFLMKKHYNGGIHSGFERKENKKNLSIIIVGSIPTKANKYNGGLPIMNSENQKLIISIFGICLIIALIGTIILAILGQGIEVITIFLGIVTTIIGILATFLTGKNMTEKQEETLEKYTIQKALNDENCSMLMGNISFDTREEMEDYLKNHTVKDMITEADTIQMDGEGDVQ